MIIAILPLRSACSSLRRSPVSDSRWRPTIETRERGVQPPCARKAGPLGYKSYRKIGAIKQTLRAPQPKRERNLQRRGIEVLGKQPRQVT
jgi:hypothetical protein